MSAPARFDRASAAGALQAAATEGGLARFRLDGGGAGFAEPITLRVGDGRILEVVEPAASPERCLEWIALAEGGTLETWDDGALVGPHPGALPILTGFAEAERAAARALDQIHGLGGLEARLRPDQARILEAPELPEAAARVVRLAQGGRTVAEVFVASPLGLELTARIVGRLARDGMLQVEGDEVAPGRQGDRGVETASQPSDALPTADEMTGAAVEADIRRWLGARQTPESLLSDEAFSSAFSDGAPSVARRVRAGVPLETRRPVAVEGVMEDHALLQDAGVGSRPPRWLLALLLLGLIGVAALYFLREPRPEPPVASTAPPPPAPVPTATTSTTADEEPAVTEVEADPPPPPSRRPRRIRDSEVVPRMEGTPLEQAAALLEAGDPEAAERILVELRASRRRDATVWRLSAQAAVDLGDNAAALRYSRRALSLAPRRFESWLVKGSALQFGGRGDEAIKAYEKALSLDAEHPRSDEVRRVIEEIRAREGADDGG